MEHRALVCIDGGISEMPLGDTIVTGIGLPSGWVSHHASGALYFGYVSYLGGGWRVLRVGADGARGFADGTNNAAATLPDATDWPALTFTGY